MPNELDKDAKFSILKELKSATANLFDLREQVKKGEFKRYESPDVLSFLLSDAIYSKNRQIREKIITICLDLTSKESLEVAIQTLIHSKNSGLRNSALQKLLEIGGDLRFVTNLLEIALNDKVTPNRTLAIEVLALCSSKEIFPDLDHIIETDNADDGSGFTPSDTAKWAKEEITRRTT